MRPPGFELMDVEIASLGNTIALRCSNLSKSLEMLSNASIPTCSDFANSGKTQQSIVPLLHGGGQGYESLGSTTKKWVFAGKM
jgi:hypothetical protein